MHYIYMHTYLFLYIYYIIYIYIYIYIQERNKKHSFFTNVSPNGFFIRLFFTKVSTNALYIYKVIKSVLRKIRNRGDVSDETLDYSCEQP